MRKGIQLLIWFLCAESAYAQNNFIDSLQNIVALHRHDSVELNALLNLTNEFSRTDFESAKYYAQQAVFLSKVTRSDLGLCNSYLYLVVLHQNLGQLDSASHYLRSIENLLVANPHNSKMRINYNQTAGLFYKNQGLYKKALPFMLNNLNLLTEENEGRAGQYLNLGNLYYNLGEYRNAATNHFQGLALFEKLKSKRGQSFCLQSLGNDFLGLKQFEQSRKYFLLSFNLKGELNDKRGLISSLTGLGDASKELGQLEMAKRYYTQALQASREMKIVSEESRCLFQLGLLYKRMDNSLLARESISAALQLARKTGDSTVSTKMAGELMALNLQEKKDNEIETTFYSNINTLVNSGDRSAESMEYSRLSEYYASKNQYGKAFYYLKKHQALKDSVEGSAVLFQIKQLEEQYQNEKKEIEIGLLKKDQELQILALSRQRIIITFTVIALISVVVVGLLLINRYRIASRAKQLIEIEKMRNSIARDLHDDIGSTLSSIKILSQVALVEQSGNTQNYLQRIGDQSSRMMEDMSDMVWSINPRNDSMEKVITRMREFAIEIFDSSGIEYRFSEKIKEELTLSSDKRKNLFLIFKEAINNAAKYSMAKAVEIELYQQDQMLILIVKDNGKGFDEQKINTGNGLRNQRERAKEINGRFTLNSQDGQGTELELQLPIA